MYRNTLFGDIMKGLPRGLFEKFVAQAQADKHTKGFRSWDQLLAMIYGQISGSRSLREIEVGFNSQAQHHYHLGTRAIKRSTLSDANAKRNSDLYERVCRYLLQTVHRKARKELADMLYLIDSSPIHLAGKHVDEWASNYKNNVSQGLKLHLMLECHRTLPVYAVLTGANVSDIKQGRHILLEQGATYVFDKGYYDYNWWHAIDTNGSWFITRLKKNAAVSLEQACVIPEQDRDTIIEDGVVVFTRKYNGKLNTKNVYQGKPVRRIKVRRPDKATPLILITNDFSRSAIEIAELYKKRWGIELFFKWIKQNLKIKRFLGCSENAVKTQIYIAMITYLLIYLYRKKQGCELSASLHLCTLRIALFQRPETEYHVAKRRRRRVEEFNERQVALAL